MDILKSEKGFSIIETLVTITIIGLIVMFSSLFFEKLFNNPQMLLKSTALYLANEEIENSINLRSKNDTTYYNNNLEIKRIIERKGHLTKINVIIAITSEEKTILSLNAYYK